MERATEPRLIEQAEQMLKECRDRLSYDSISLFKEDGTLLYSTDEFMTKQKDTVSLFEALDAIVYAFVIGVPRTIIVNDNERCLIIKPIFVEDYGVVEAWLFALGDCRTLSCDWISKELVKQCKNNMKKDISATLENESMKSILRRSFDFPKILGHEFNLENGSMIILDGDDGIIALSHGGLPWGIETRGGRLYPDVIMGLEELDMKIQMDTPNGVFIPPKPEYVWVQVKESDYSKSNRLLLLVLAYSGILMLPDLRLAPVFLIADIMIVIYLIVVRIVDPKGFDWMCSGLMVGAGIIIQLAGIVSLGDFFELSLIWLFVGLYLFMIGILLFLNIGGKEKYGYRVLDHANNSQHSEFKS